MYKAGLFTHDQWHSRPVAYRVPIFCPNLPLFSPRLKAYLYQVSHSWCIDNSDAWGVFSGARFPGAVQEQGLLVSQVSRERSQVNQQELGVVLKKDRVISDVADKRVLSHSLAKSGVSVTCYCIQSILNSTPATWYRDDVWYMMGLPPIMTVVQRSSQSPPRGEGRCKAQERHSRRECMESKVSSPVCIDVRSLGK